MKKSTLNKMAKLIETLDADIFGMNRESEEYKKTQAARTALIDVIFENGFELSLDYKIVKSETKRTINDF